MNNIGDVVVNLVRIFIMEVDNLEILNVNLKILKLKNKITKLKMRKFKRQIHIPRNPQNKILMKFS